WTGRARLLGLPRLAAVRIGGLGCGGGGAAARRAARRAGEPGSGLPRRCPAATRGRAGGRAGGGRPRRPRRAGRRPAAARAACAATRRRLDPGRGGQLAAAGVTAEGPCERAFPREPSRIVASPDGVPIAVFETGVPAHSSENPTLLLVHGTTADHTTFRA